MDLFGRNEGSGFGFPPIRFVNLTYRLDRSTPKVRVCLRTFAWDTRSATLKSDNHEWTKAGEADLREIFQFLRKELNLITGRGRDPVIVSAG